MFIAADECEEVEQQCQHVMSLLEQQFGDIFWSLSHYQQIDDSPSLLSAEWLSNYCRPVRPKCPASRVY